MSKRKTKRRGVSEEGEEGDERERERGLKLFKGKLKFSRSGIRKATAGSSRTRSNHGHDIMTCSRHKHRRTNHQVSVFRLRNKEEEGGWGDVFSIHTIHTTRQHSQHLKRFACQCPDFILLDNTVICLSLGPTIHQSHHLPVPTQINHTIQQTHQSCQSPVIPTSIKQ